MDQSTLYTSPRHTASPPNPTTFSQIHLILCRHPEKCLAEELTTPTHLLRVLQPVARQFSPLHLAEDSPVEL